ncbi:Ketopantoate reductase-like protein [Mycena sanguinolenta]|uniref:Ketopantoate reductase-like protein n=1 Tax=Mycena sanguinolenta TaxID=230812 RepID=A0A8H7CKI0_9AGAR|nr:Ketopantoate reductase-like protein [Mycena sanguinolenta]
MAEDCINYAMTNPDIAGIGVRVSFYLQTFLLVILVDRSWQDAPTALWTFIATSFGLTIATIVQHQSDGQLTLFQALQVSNLVWLANFGTFVALASYSRQKASHTGNVRPGVGADYNVKFGAMIQTLFSMALTIYMWANAPSFGSIPACSHLVNYMVFAVKVPALGTGRIIGLTASSILTAAYLLITLHELRSYRRSRKDRIECPAGVSVLSPPTYPTIPKAASSTSTSTMVISMTYHKPSQPQAVQSPKTATSEIPPMPSKRRPRRRRWSYEVDPMLIGIMICQILVFTYFIVSSELLLAYNDGAYASAQQMGFGQILALIVVLPSALSVIGALKEHGLKRLSKRKKANNLRRRRDRRMSLITEHV